jgi:hypothetical protein
MCIPLLYQPVKYPQGMRLFEWEHLPKK